MGVRVWARVTGSSAKPHKGIPWPDLMLIEETAEESSRVRLTRYTRDGEFGGETSHASVEEAKGQAAFEAGENLGRWRDIPRDAPDPVAFILDHHRRDG